MCSKYFWCQARFAITKFLTQNSFFYSQASSLNISQALANPLEADLNLFLESN